MIAPKTEARLSPLDQIRQSEAEVTRQIAAARESAEAKVAEARAQAAQLKRQAREVGSRSGQASFKEILATAEEEAQIIQAQANQRARELRRRGEASMQAAIREAVAFVIGFEAQEQGLYEP
jgi:vacuolar-type H+-ATPase subunit H